MGGRSACHGSSGGGGVLTVDWLGRSMREDTSSRHSRVESGPDGPDLGMPRKNTTYYSLLSEARLLFSISIIESLVSYIRTIKHILYKL